MAKNFTEEEKSKIITEYQAAVAEGNGGGAAVAKQYGVHSANIIGWAKSRGKAGAKPSRRTAPPTLAEETHLRARIDADLNALIKYHETRALNLRRLRDGAHA